MQISKNKFILSNMNKNLANVEVKKGKGYQKKILFSNLKKRRKCLGDVSN